MRDAYVHISVVRTITGEKDKCIAYGRIIIISTLISCQDKPCHAHVISVRVAESSSFSDFI